MTSTIVLKLEDASWRQAHEELVRLATERAGLDFEEGRWLVRAHRSGAHVRLGYASFHEYTERLFGYGPRLTQEKLRVAEALEDLPETARDLQTGAISFSLARELTRVATPSAEKEWLEAARGRTLREVEHLVSGHRPGSLPDDVPDSQLKRHVLRLGLSGEVFATFREAMAKIRRDAGESLDDDGAMLLLCRQALEGPEDPGRSSYQIALTVCESCRRAKQQGRGELIDVGPEIVAMAECDGQHIGHVDGNVDVPDASARGHVGIHDKGSARAHVGVDDDENIRAGVLDDANARLGVRGNARAYVGIHDDVNIRADVHDDANAQVCVRGTYRAHVGIHDDVNIRADVLDDANARADGGGDARDHVDATRFRATQTIPPALRRAVLRRDGGKCRVPGCRHAIYTDVHHIALRSEDGKHGLDNLVTLCSAHHYASHNGKLSITGAASSHLHFAHADGTPYGGAVTPAVADARARAFQALTGLGYREGQVRRALARVPKTVSSLEQLVRQALRELAPQ
jgi:5-methylcytosine-specific restriction endonuclease McrA